MIMRNKCIRIGLVLGLALLLSGTTIVSSSFASPPSPAKALSISGTIYGLPLDGTGVVPVEGAQVFLIGGKLIGGITFALEKSAPTNEEGHYSFSDIPIGIFFVMARKPGEYIGSFRIVRLTPDQPTKQNQDITMIRIGGGNSSQTVDLSTTQLAPHEQLGVS